MDNLYFDVPKVESNIEFVPFQKISRYSRKVTVTEKIDGTNGCVFVGEDGEFLVGSRSRWITPGNDNHGFAAWSYEHKEELLQLGPGRHFGEFWGSGIQRGYGLQKGDKRFSLFNVSRWCLYGQEPKITVNGEGVEKVQSVLPECVGLVPVLWEGTFDNLVVGDVLRDLHLFGSVAAPGFMAPEGIVIYHTAAGMYFKKTFKNDEGKHK